MFSDFEVVFNANSEDEVADVADEASVEASTSHDYEDGDKQEQDVIQTQEALDASVPVEEDATASCSSKNLSEALKNLSVTDSQVELQNDEIEPIKEEDLNLKAVEPNLPEYNTLGIKVKACIEELNQPSAPLSGKKNKARSDFFF